jgi:hypothetical protein
MQQELFKSGGLPHRCRDRPLYDKSRAHSCERRAVGNCSSRAAGCLTGTGPAPFCIELLYNVHTQLILHVLNILDLVVRPMPRQRVDSLDAVGPECWATPRVWVGGLESQAIPSQQVSMSNKQCVLLTVLGSCLLQMKMHCRQPHTSECCAIPNGRIDTVTSVRRHSSASVAAT